MVSKETILGFKGKAPTPVEIPEWGGTVYVKIMRGFERDSYENETYSLKGKNVELNRLNARARLLVRCLVDAEGKNIFDVKDADSLGNQPADILDKLHTVALKVNGFTAEDIEDLTKKS